MAFLSPRIQMSRRRLKTGYRPLLPYFSQFTIYCQEPIVFTESQRNAQQQTALVFQKPTYRHQTLECLTVKSHIFSDNLHEI